ncbi:conjugal transfer protein TrbH [Agrobacterium tumefaciens]|uniref:conjugal transfer protein TrbH n=1 Tax=Agrobacterium tumefaciens TaxID=358 RepID=UPI002243A940|nr:conjugal transfer protein TrbH [Agrobacterium tumefaciens]
MRGNSILRVLAFAWLSASLASCMSTGSYFSPQSSTDAANLQAPAADAVAADMVARLAEYVGPGTGTIVLKTDDSAFAAAFDKHLRAWGYAVDPAATGPKAIALAYTVDSLDGAAIARVSTPSVELARQYQATTTGAIASSPLSIMKRSETSGGQGA